MKVDKKLNSVLFAVEAEIRFSLPTWAHGYVCSSTHKNTSAEAFSMTYQRNKNQTRTKDHQAGEYLCVIVYDCACDYLKLSML